ncbi:protein CURVATURE THYLAKOID 1B, chloroplastic-like [Typha latifolia]|uniref:protein CURVATURE THYLAKOID 1B, chloroplastic-like n=1 Tax=Typha latifolia TaxID=4733 RepID=UPI003C2E60C4
MASTTAATCAATSPAAVEAKPTLRRHMPHSIGLPPLPSPPRAAAPGRLQNASYCRRIARDVVAMAVGEASAGVATELPEIVNTIQGAWDRLEDKYAVTSLAFAGFIALWSTSGMISAIDRLPVVPGALELVGIGYSGWFAYRNLVFKPEREALLTKIKGLYNDIIGSS